MSTKDGYGFRDEDILEALENPLVWAEAILNSPHTEGTFKANYVEKKILGSKSQLVVLRLHRRSGKSTSLAILAIWGAIVHQRYEVLIVGPEEGHVAELFDKIWEFLNVNPEIRKSITEKTKTPHLIKFSNGSSIKGKSAGSTGNRESIGIRGKGADLLLIDEAAYLKDKDFVVLNAMIYNDQYKEEVKVYAASTPTVEHGRYYDWCLNRSLGWEEIHVSLPDNPDIPEKNWRAAYAMASELEWMTEHMAEFPDIGENVFKGSDIDGAKEKYHYSLDNIDPSTKKCIGVDWDKYQAGVNIVVAEMNPGMMKYRVIYREEVPKGEYTLTKACERVIGLNKLLMPDYIYVDRGYGEQAVETLRLHGVKNPETKLKEKVIGVTFSDSIKSIDPVDGSERKRQFKAAMLSSLCNVFEQSQISFPEDDKKFDNQLRTYKIVGMGSGGIQTSRRNEHIIDACGLAIFGLVTNFKNELQFHGTRQIVTLPARENSKPLVPKFQETEYFKPMRSAMTSRKVYDGIGRGVISSGPLVRNKF